MRLQPSFGLLYQVPSLCSPIEQHFQVRSSIRFCYDIGPHTLPLIIRFFFNRLLQTLTTGLSSSSRLPDSARSYDLVWLLHLVGDAHQPLHAPRGFQRPTMHGDQGGNLEDVISSKGSSRSCTPIGTACSVAIQRLMARSSMA
ncbi:S1/P1 nuclease [Rhizobium sp. BK650]|uniref:S1/P1 nuclease n=1 Tax=Rhizobium sp. BK650 TaxID=2586990 RepID=UPI001618CB5E